MADPMSAAVVEADLHHQLGPERAHSVAVGAPPAGGGVPCSPLSYGASSSTSSRARLALNAEVWPMVRSSPSVVVEAEDQRADVPSGLPGRQPITTCRSCAPA